MANTKQGKADPWYADGLTFTCTQCGNCCTGGPGYVWFNEREGRAMAEYLGLSVEAFYQRYARPLYNRWSLDEIDVGRNQFDCIFLTQRDDGSRGCSIYPVRPQQCRTWPFWPENLKSKSAWKSAAEDCPGMKAGMDGDGTFYPVEKIRIIRDSNDQL